MVTGGRSVREGIGRTPGGTPPRSVGTSLRAGPSRGRHTDRGSHRGDRPPFRTRGGAPEVEEPAGGLGKAFDPSLLSRICLFSGIAALAIGILGGLLTIAPEGLFLRFLTYPFLVLGVLGTALSGLTALIVLVTGEEDDQNLAYLWIGLSIVAMIILAVAFVLGY